MILCYYVGMSENNGDRDAAGRFIRGNSGAITRDTAREFQKGSVAARRENGRKAVRIAFAQGEDVTDMNVTGGAALIAETLFGIATNKKNKDAATKAAALLWKMVGYFDKEERIKIPGPRGSVITAPISSALDLLQALDRAEKGQKGTNELPAEQKGDDLGENVE